MIKTPEAFKHSNFEIIIIWDFSTERRGYGTKN